MKKTIAILSLFALLISSCTSTETNDTAATTDTTCVDSSAKAAIGIDSTVKTIDSSKVSKETKATTKPVK